MAITAPRTGYAPVNGLKMYYEVHGPATAHSTIMARADLLLPMVRTFLDAPMPGA